MAKKSFFLCELFTESEYFQIITALEAQKMKDIPSHCEYTKKLQEKVREFTSL